MIIPIADRLLVERVVGPETTEGGIVIPSTVADNDARAVEYFVVAVGPGKKVSEVKPKEFVLASTYAGKEVVSGRRKLRMIEWADVLAKVTHPPDPPKPVDNPPPAE